MTAVTRSVVIGIRIEVIRHRRRAPSVGSLHPQKRRTFENTEPVVNAPAAMRSTLRERSGNVRIVTKWTGACSPAVARIGSWLHRRMIFWSGPRKRETDYSPANPFNQCLSLDRQSRRVAKGALRSPYSLPVTTGQIHSPGPGAAVYHDREFLAAQRPDQTVV